MRKNGEDEESAVERQKDNRDTGVELALVDARGQENLYERPE